MKLLLAALLATASLSANLATAAHAVTIITNTPYNPNSDTTLANFSNGNENVAETTTFQNDPNGLGFDFTVQTDPVGIPNDRSDRVAADQFTNVYFGAGDATGAQVVFEFGNEDAFNLNTNQKYTYTSALGILYQDIPGATALDPSMSQVYVPYAAYDTVLQSLGITPDPTIQVRDLQAFSYGGNNAGGEARFGTILNLAPIGTVPESGTWAMMFVGVAVIGSALRRKPRTAVGYAFA